MKKGVHNHVQEKSRKLLRLYSQWQETRQEAIQRRCLTLLGEILAVEPHFSLQGTFRKAF